jgi:hypothetical protein
MPTIMHFSENGLVGVLKPCCTTADDRIRALTASHPIKPTSTRCRSAWQPNPGRGSTYRSGKAVQTTGTTSGRCPPKADSLCSLSSVGLDPKQTSKGHPYGGTNLALDRLPDISSSGVEGYRPKEIKYESCDSIHSAGCGRFVLRGRRCAKSAATHWNGAVLYQGRKRPDQM